MIALARVVTVVVRRSCGATIGFPSTLDYGTSEYTTSDIDRAVNGTIIRLGQATP